MKERNPCPVCEGRGIVDGEACPDCAAGAGTARLAGELYARSGTPCATCTCSFMPLKPSPGTALGFEAGDGLTLRVCTLGREPLEAESGTQRLWCSDYSGFSDRVPLPPEDLHRMLAECSRGFLGDLANQLRPLPRDRGDLGWYDRGLREGWLPEHSVQHSEDGKSISGPWEQFVVIGLIGAPTADRVPELVQPVLQMKGGRTYLVPTDLDADEAQGEPMSHGWWVSQVASGDGLQLEHPVEARPSARLLVLRSEPERLSPHAYAYLAPPALEKQLDQLASQSLRAAQGALKRSNQSVALLCVEQGLRARPAHPELVELRRQLDAAH